MKTLRAFVGLLLIVAVGSVGRAGQAVKGPVKVFILAGQSNMEGHGKIKADVNKNGGMGSLEYLVKDPVTKEQFKHLVDKQGQWKVRKDVWIWYLGRKGGLSVGYGASADRIGPELQFGNVLGDYFDEQVLLIKTSWGGKSLAKDFRPPSSGGEVGPYYKEMLGHIRDVLSNISEHFSGYEDQGYEICGIGWHQGWNDGCGVEASDEYEKNMVNFIADVRRELGVEKLPFVIANSGFGGRNQKISRRLKIMEAQAAAAKYERFEGTAACVETRDFFRPPEVSPSRQGYHWNGNAETYFLIGDGMGKAMKALCLIRDVGPSGDESIAPKEMVYKSVGDVELKLHVFDCGGSGSRPAIVFFFGGGWVGGSPSQFFPHCRYLASRGMVAISAEYRVKSRNNTTPAECVKDGKSAIRWVRAHASELGIDPHRIAAGGGSAGGHVAAATGALEGFYEPGEDRNISSKPNALVLFNPVYDNGPEGYGHDRVKEYWRKVSPMHNIDGDVPPTIVFFGANDRLVPVSTIEEYDRLMDKAGVRCDTHVYDGQPHGFFNYRDDKNDYYFQTVAETDKFLTSLGYLQEKPAQKR